jgi:peptidoglycan/xylan/chitin deacetylase (PgdA/CDA1 family)
MTWIELSFGQFLNKLTGNNKEENDMPKQITIVMYHFVRDLQHSRYPKIKGITIKEFKEQLSYIENHYHFVTIKDCIDAIYFNKDIPNNAVLLTFDDAYIDHYLTVFPLLNEKKIQGCFFPSAKSVLRNEVLDVNKIHFILATAPKSSVIIDDIKLLLKELRNKYNLNSYEYYFKKLAHASRFDTKEVIFIKRLLQVELNREVRGTITDRLFSKYVTKDEISFARELYMNTEHLKCMVRNGMYVGGHGYDHYWLNTLNSVEQKKEIKYTIDFLSQINSPIDKWVMSYPFGAYDDSLVNILKENNCIMALTTKVDVAQLSKNNAYTLERLDTNDLPKEANASPNSWTKKVL